MFAHLLNYFPTSNTFLIIPILLQAQKDDSVLFAIYTWLEQKQKQTQINLTPDIKAYPLLYTHYKQFQQLYKDPNFHLFHIIHLTLKCLKKVSSILKPL